MEQHQRLCSLLFQSASKAGHYKDLKIYYFHNCVEWILYTEPTLNYLNTVSTEWVLQNLGGGLPGDPGGRRHDGPQRSGFPHRPDLRVGLADADQGPLSPRHLAPPPASAPDAQLLDRNL